MTSRENTPVPADLEPELDRLYGVELGEFVAERTTLVRALKKEGRSAEAAQVQELRKPSLPAWIVNQLVRRNRKDVDLLLAAGRRLEEAQRAMLGGGEREPFAEAREHEQAASRPLREAARKLVGQGGSEATLERVSSTLRAAALTAEGRAQLAQGRLTSEIDPPGFEAFAGATAAEAGSGRRASPAKSKPSEKRRSEGDRMKARKEATAKARASLKAAREREAVLGKQLRKAEQAVRGARAALDTAEREAERARTEAEAAAEAVEVSRRELDSATEA